MRVPVRPAVLRRRRLVALVLISLVVLGGWLALQAALGRTGDGPLAVAGPPGGTGLGGERVWVVEPGDTLWSIAVASGAHGDIRPLVDRLSAEVGGRPLAVGQRIVVP
ncbi:MAG: LysM peptidoglycan-binding domain-containing protein [Acidimicrobiales bacterium]